MAEDRVSRGRTGRIDQMPDDLREMLHAHLRDKGLTQAEILERINVLLAERGAPPLSRSGLNRYATRMEQMGSRIREARAISEQWIATLGTEPQGEVSHILIEMLRTLAFDVTLKMANGEDEVEPKFIKELAIGIERLEKAASESFKREQEIRRLALEQAAEKAEAVAKRGGLSSDTVQALRREILGIAA